ncbi:HtaA domain-containing protein [Actinokineospora auranticolor]|uniref:HtaA domain-containing protein n=1 Tax=Actinokineospora auranticolor TaxID=155976 RepID=UPI001C67921A
MATITRPSATPTNGVLTWQNTPATLASSEAFAGFYQAGADLDPITLVLAAHCATPPTTPPAANPAAPPAVTPTQNLVPEARFRPAQHNP